MRREDGGDMIIVHMDLTEAEAVLRSKKFCEEKFGSRFDDKDLRHQIIDALLVGVENMIGK